MKKTIKILLLLMLAIFFTSYGASIMAATKNVQNTGNALVDIKNNAFSPATITVNKGATVEWKNLDTSAHTATGSGFDSGNISPGGVYKMKFDKAGTFSYYCKIHPTMKGTVIVK